MKTTIRLLLIPILSLQVLAQRTEQNFNAGWKFIKADLPDSAAAQEYADSSWQAVHLPHDWAISGPFDSMAEDGGSGKLPWRGVGWYRKSFTIPAVDSGKCVYLDFDGVMAFPEVFVNGTLAGHWDYGYVPFRIDATPYIRSGARNTVAVRVDTRKHATRWYPGAGIYRNVKLVTCAPVHVAHWGTCVTTPMASDTAAAVQVRASIENSGNADTRISITIELAGPDGRVVASGTIADTVPAHGSRDIEQSFRIHKPVRWDIGNPALYSAKTSVLANGKPVDADHTRFGIRVAEFTADDGFHLNGRRVQLQGVDLHHDLGPLGAAFNRRAMERELAIMNNMGVNALRTSHNPPAAEVLDLCDSMGILVWDECFDKWGPYADMRPGERLETYGEKQLRNFVMRDRNHPCVIIWSIGNEMASQPRDSNGMSPERNAFMRDYVRRYDPTRPVGMACDNTSLAAKDNHTLDSLDVVGWNYGRRYLPFRKRYPAKPIVYSESGSAVSSYGFYELPLPRNKTAFSKQFQVDSYDHNAMGYSDIPDVEFSYMEKDRYVAGEFVWTGFDYLGEPSPFSRQARSSYFGIVDLCGIPKDRYYLYRSHWRSDATTIHILPHWNWPERKGKPVPVYIYTNGDSAELFLNGKSLGARAKSRALPDEPLNLACGLPSIASSEERDPCSNANDGNSYTRWTASAGDTISPRWQVDLGSEQSVRLLSIDFARSADHYPYFIKASNDGALWKTVVTKNDWSGAENRMEHDVDLQARFLRIQFAAAREARAGIREFGVYSQKNDLSYYSVTDHYRLRWNDVVYEPGEVRAVAYKNGKKIGESIMRTAGAPHTLRLTPDRTVIAANGDGLSYILIEAIDAKGNPCPLADNSITVSVAGPGTIAALANGNPLSMEPFQDASHMLFFGKAMLIIRGIEGKAGVVRVTAGGKGLRESKATINTMQSRTDR
jgi:beta-galactosidase